MSGDSSTRRLRLTLTLGFGGMLLIFLMAGVDAVRLLGRMRAENKILRDASLERSQRLASVRSYILLSRSFMGDSMIDSNAQRSEQRLEELRNAWSRALMALSNYRTTTLNEEVLLKQLQDLVERQWESINRVIGASRATANRQNFYQDQVLPLRTELLEITTRVDDVDARQLAATESATERQFESMGRQLSVVLNIALGAALLLALGCIIYILRIEAQNRRHYQEILTARTALEQLSARLLAAHEDERRSISRELHDEVGQTLNAVLVDAANLANRISPDDAVAHHYLDSIRTLADASVNSIRNIALLLRPSMLDDLGLIPALEWQAREVSRRSRIKVKVVAGGVPDSLPDDLRTCIYRVVQEALHNVARHSGAASALVTVRYLDHRLDLTVEDDGSGFDPERTRGMGLLGMEERVKQLHGHLEIHSRPGTGTVLHVTLPAPQAFEEAPASSEETPAEPAAAPAAGPSVTE
jgi:signal transduction histidine kinase